VFDAKWIDALEGMAAGEDSDLGLDGNSGGIDQVFSKTDDYKSVTPSSNASLMSASS
jgi:hypothetical protein